MKVADVQLSRGPLFARKEPDQSAKAKLLIFLYWESAPILESRLPFRVRRSLLSVVTSRYPFQARDGRSPLPKVRPHQVHCRQPQFYLKHGFAANGEPRRLTLAVVSGELSTTLPSLHNLRLHHPFNLGAQDTIFSTRPQTTTHIRGRSVVEGS